MKFQTARSILLRVTALILLTALVPVYRLSYGQQQASLSHSEQPPIRLRIQTNKRIYRVDEPIELSVYLENVSQDRSYYVGRDIDGIHDLTHEFHAVRLTIVDMRGRKVQLPQGASVSDELIYFDVNGKAVPPHRPTVAEKLAKEYVRLPPQAFLGFRREIFEAYENGRYRNYFRAGHYRFQVTYQEIEALSWTEAEKKSLETPVWEQPLTSNIVEISVVAK
jgi:hypothetical protein